MTQAPQATETTTVTVAQPAPSAETQKPEPQQETTQTVPYERFQQVNTKLRELEAAQQKRDDDDRKSKEKAAKERGEWERLANDREQELGTIKPQLQTATERLAALEALLEDEVKDGLKELPEAIRALAPSGDILEQRQWLAKAQKAAGDAPLRNPGTPAGPRGAGANQPLQPVAVKRNEISF